MEQNNVRKRASPAAFAAVRIDPRGGPTRRPVNPAVSVEGAAEGQELRRMLVDARLGPRGSAAVTSAVAARGTVEMLSAPEWVKVSTDVPSQPCPYTHGSRFRRNAEP
jgi:hypothetical protein